MDITTLQKRAVEIRKKYQELERITEGAEWTDVRLARGFLTDVTDLVTLVETSADKEKIGHELSDCLWSVLILAARLRIDLPQSFITNMNILEQRIDEQLNAQKQKRV